MLTGKPLLSGRAPRPRHPIPRTPYPLPGPPCLYCSRAARSDGAGVELSAPPASRWLGPAAGLRERLRLPLGRRARDRRQLLGRSGENSGVSSVERVGWRRSRGRNAAQTSLHRPPGVADVSILRLSAPLVHVRFCYHPVPISTSHTGCMKGIVGEQEMAAGAHNHCKMARQV